LSKYSQLLDVVNDVPTTKIEDDGLTLATDLRRLGKSECRLHPPPDSPRVEVPKPLEVRIAESKAAERQSGGDAGSTGTGGDSGGATSTPGASGDTGSSGSASTPSSSGDTSAGSGDSGSTGSSGSSGDAGGGSSGDAAPEAPPPPSGD
jgi:hypothetical protein